jgi:hypothetical protein
MEDLMEDSLRLALDCAAAQWAFRIGDPHPLGWTATLGAALAALAAAGVARRAPFPAASRTRERAFWCLLALALALYALNKQLDLQTFVTATGRCMARAQGWYAERRGVQRDFVLALLAAAGLAGLLLLLWLRGTLARSGPALAGLVLLGGFVAVRAASIHHMDVALRAEVFSIRLWRLWELGAIALVLFAALLMLRRAPPPG